MADAIATEAGLYGAASPPPRRVRVVAAVGLVAALALLALVLAHWGWTWFGPAPAVIAVPVSETDLAARAASTRLFGSSTPTPDNAPAGADLGDLRLLGVFAESGGNGYALFRAGSRGAILAEPGDEIAPGIRLERVRPDGVNIIDGGVPRDLSLRSATPAADASRPAAGSPQVALAAPASKPAAGAPQVAPAASAARPAACVPPPGFKGPIVRLNAELLGGMIDAPAAWNALVARASGALVVRDQSGYAGMLGLKNGDRVERANGIALEVPDDIPATVIKPLVRSQQVWLQGTRGGKPQQWLYLNAGACPG
ncbi:MAG TPA: hypothetical protein VJQ49_04670 [Casimicrobiaceae bacterium]|nr:hypothetical protein [Casimicrobiaceae bacterium]